MGFSLVIRFSNSRPDRFLSGDEPRCLHSASSTNYLDGEVALLLDGLTPVSPARGEP
jgi:hypothetical protein